MDKVSEIPKKWIGFEVELGCHMRQDGIETGGFADAGAFLCEAHEDLFGIEGNAEAGCGAGLGEFGTHMFRVYLDHGHPEISGGQRQGAGALAAQGASPCPMLQAPGRGRARAAVRAFRLLEPPGLRVGLPPERNGIAPCVRPLAGRVLGAAVVAVDSVPGHCADPLRGWQGR